MLLTKCATGDVDGSSDNRRGVGASLQAADTIDYWHCRLYLD